MRGTDKQQVSMLSLVTPDKRVPAGHPLRKVKVLADQALAALSPTFDEMYSKKGRPSIPPERLLKATLLMAFHSIRSERLFCEQLDYNLLFRWFLDMDMVEESFDHSTFSQNRKRLLEHDVAANFLGEVVKPRGTSQIRPTGDGSKPANGQGPRPSSLLSRRRLRVQRVTRAPALRAAA